MLNDNGVTEGLDVYNANMLVQNAQHGKAERGPFHFGDGRVNGNREYLVT